MSDRYVSLRMFSTSNNSGSNISVMKQLLLLSLLVLPSLQKVFAQVNNNMITNVSVVEFKGVMDSLKDEIVVDLRTPDELKQGKIPGATVIDYFGADFEPALQKLDKNKVYLLYCAGGGRSGDTAELMSKMGFKKVYNLESGFNAWVKQKMPVEK